MREPEGSRSIGEQKLERQTPITRKNTQLLKPGSALLATYQLATDLLTTNTHHI